VSIAQSGERKTAIDSYALSPVRTYEEKLRREYDPAWRNWRNAHDAWDAQRKQVLRGNKHKTYAEKQTALEAIGPEPLAPLYFSITPNEPTLEGLVRYMKNAMPSLGIFSAEGGTFIAGHSMTEENRLRLAANVSVMWDEGKAQRVRVDEVTFLAGRRLAMHLMVQPNVAVEMMRDPLLIGQGLLSRVLMCAPPSTIGTRFYRKPAPASGPALRRYEDRILELLEQNAPLAEGSRNELNPPVLTFTPEASRAWIGFADTVEEKMKPGGDYESIRAFANKLAEHAARLAGVLAVVRGDSMITFETLDAGMKLARFYATEALRFAQAGYEDPELKLAEDVLKWITGHFAAGEPFTLRDLCRLGPNAVRSAETARRMMRLLVEYGYLTGPAPAEIDGRSVREAWRRVR
jgi:hypothetical protein